MKLRALIERAVDEQSGRLAGKIADVCRFRMGKNYRETFDLVQCVRPALTLPEWDALLYEADEMA